MPSSFSAPLRRLPALAAALLGTTFLTLPAALAQQTDAVTTPPVQVKDSGITDTTAGQVDGYRATNSKAATKTDTPLNQIPQAIQVVPRSVIDDQQPIFQSDVLFNVSGTQPVTPLFAGQVGPKVRGFSAERFIDGLPNYYDLGARDLLNNVERIEVMKGPSSILYQGGSTPTGGVVNVISRMPTRTPSMEFSLTGGSHNYVSPTFDINQPLTADGTVLMRITGQYERTNSHIDVIKRDSYSLDPTLLFTNNEGTSLLLQGRISERKQHDYPGLPAVGTLDRSAYSVERDLFPSDDDVPRSRSQNLGITARFDHKFNDTWSTFTTVRYSTTDFREPAQTILSNMPDLPPSVFGIFNSKLSEDTTELSINSNVVAKFATGPAQHRVLLGADFNRVTDKGYLNAELAGLVDFDNPVFPPYTDPPLGPFTTFGNPDNLYRQGGVTLQLQSTLWERVHILGALRLAYVDIKSRDLTLGTEFHTKETKLLPRIGVAVDVFEGFTVFASYVEGLRAVPFFNGANAPKPEESRQYEAGVKFNFGFGLSGSAAVFELTRRNVATADPANPFLQVQTGEQRARGFEADLVWQPDKHWAFLAAYTYLDAEIVKDNTLASGNRLTFAPKHSGRLWGRYLFTDGPLQGLSLGAGLTALSKQAVTLTNDYFTDGYVIFDAAAAYEWRNLYVAVTGKNLTDRKYFVPYPYFDGRVAPADGRTAYATLGVRF